MENKEDYPFLSLMMDEQIYVIEDKSAEKVQVEEPMVRELKIYGENKRKYLILVSYETNDILKSNEYDFLIKILNAIELSINDISLVNLKESPIDYASLREEIQFDHAVVFGISKEELQLTTEKSVERYEIQKLDGAQFLFAHPLSELMADKHKKLQLWKTLQLLQAM
ncbi:hypothetical protein R9208_10830 [Flammeovirgaceae bacterium SG7u.132]|nr:hypothetical protein [Flammeovirgaceae bacterium SG7u.132]